MSHPKFNMMNYKTKDNHLSSVDTYVGNVVSELKKPDRNIQNKKTSTQTKSGYSVFFAFFNQLIMNLELIIMRLLV